MAEWRTPVFDRTMDDVKSVDRTSAAYQKGALNADDLNRIEDNYKYLMAKLRSDAIFIPHRLRNFTETVLEYVEKENSILPEGYTPVEYIQSSGTQYINTEFIPTQDSYVKIKFSSENPGNCVLGCDVAWGDDGLAIGCGYAEFADTVTNTGANFSVSADVIYEVEMTSEGKLYVNGSLVWTATKTNFTTSCPLTLFCLNRGGEPREFSSVKIYFVELGKNAVAERKYIPYANSSGAGVFYDLVNGTLYENAGSGTFSVGAKVETEPTYELVETTTTYTDWQEHNLPWLSEINRIRANYNALVRLFLIGLGLPVSVESNYLDYQEVNDWERIALVGKEMFENMEKEYLRCNTVICGGDILL